MKNKYPKLSPGVILRPDETEEDMVLIIDLYNEKVCDCGTVYGKFVQSLDGKTDPYKIDVDLTREEREETLDFLEKNGLLMHGCISKVMKGQIFFHLFTPKGMKGSRALCRVLNFLLSIVWLPVLFWSLLNFNVNLEDYSFVQYILGFPIGMIIGMTVHEIAHAVASVAYGCNVLEIGAALLWFVVPSAYVLTDPDSDLLKYQKLQRLAAGIESNFLLVGVLIFLSSKFPVIGSFAFSAVLVNLVLGFSNLLLQEGMDGYTVMCTIFGCYDLADKCKKVVFDKKVRKRLSKTGVHGYAKIFLSYIVCAFQWSVAVEVIAFVIWVGSIWFI